jgi:hypothetical protein
MTKVYLDKKTTIDIELAVGQRFLYDFTGYKNIFEITKIVSKGSGDVICVQKIAGYICVGAIYNNIDMSKNYFFYLPGQEKPSNRAG